MWLSEHFHITEFVNSNEARRRGINNTPSKEAVDNLILVCENILEPVRAQFKSPVRISSGYRSPQLNRAIGGSANSQHCWGMACDFEIPDLDNCDLAQWVADNLTFDQLILEFHDHVEGPNSGWVHASFNAEGNRSEILTASIVNGRTVYSRGFPW
jgi:hypothetical protein